MAVIVPYETFVEITGLTHDNTHRTSGDLSAFLQNPSATGIIVNVKNTNAAGAVGGVYGVNSGGTSWADTLAGTAGGLYCAVRFQTLGRPANGLKYMKYVLENAGVKAYIVGEFHSGLAWHHVSIQIEPLVYADNNQWLDRTVTVLGTDSVSDVEAVVLTFATQDTTADGFMGLRAKGSSHEELFGLTYAKQGQGWEIVKVDSNGQYQIYCSAKEDPYTQGTLIKEMGYIRKNAGYTAIEDPVQETLADFGAWATPSFAGTVPASARTVVTKWGWQTGSVAASFSVVHETPDGTVGSYVIFGEERSGCEVTHMNLASEVGYISTHAGMGLWVVGYESYEPADDTTTLTIDSEVDLVIESNSPGGIG